MLAVMYMIRKGNSNQSWALARELALLLSNKYAMLCQDSCGKKSLTGN